MRPLHRIEEPVNHTIVGPWARGIVPLLAVALAA
jgi:hypothetical protein